MSILTKKKQVKPDILEIPKHVAIIMDGNARWAKLRKLPIKAGHKFGSDNLIKVAKNCIELGIKYLSVYAFSTENWNRPKDEVDYIMNLLKDYLNKERQQLMENGVKLVVSGNMNKLDQETINEINYVQKLTNNNSKIILNIAFSYGARQEIVDALKKISLAIEQNKIKFNEINEELVSKNLYFSELPDPDLLIRTAGELRVSNFLLWQIAYTEFYFTKTFWPDFDKKELQKAINSFNQRERRYGKR